jgi:hypothetical protein
MVWNRTEAAQTRRASRSWHAEQIKEGPMKVVMMVAAAGCVLVALLFARVSGNADWSGAIMATFFAGIAGALVAVAAG